MISEFSSAHGLSQLNQSCFFAMVFPTTYSSSEPDSNFCSLLTSSLRARFCCRDLICSSKSPESSDMYFSSSAYLRLVPARASPGWLAAPSSDVFWASRSFVVFYAAFNLF